MVFATSINGGHFIGIFYTDNQAEIKTCPVLVVVASQVAIFDKNPVFSEMV